MVHRESPGCRCAVDTERLPSWGSSLPAAGRGPEVARAEKVRAGAMGGHVRAGTGGWGQIQLDGRVTRVPAGGGAASRVPRRLNESVQLMGSLSVIHSDAGERSPGRPGSVLARRLLGCSLGQQTGARGTPGSWLETRVSGRALGPSPVESSSEGESCYLAHTPKGEGSTSSFAPRGLGIRFARRTLCSDCGRRVRKSTRSIPGPAEEAKAASLWAVSKCGDGAWRNDPCTALGRICVAPGSLERRAVPLR